MSTLSAILITITGGLLVAVILLFRLAELRRIQRDDARGEANESDRERLRMSGELSTLMGLDDSEFMEHIREEYRTETVKSDEWEVQVPYGKWTEFPIEDGSPPASIRAFWPGVPAKIFGVKLPVGGHYVMHRHRWAETLVCLTGTMLVQVEDVQGNIISTTLNRGQSIYIPGNARHAVAQGTQAARFICVWTHHTQ